MLALELPYYVIYTVMGGYVIARLAPQNSIKLVIILGIIGTIAGCIGIYVEWGMSEHWYPVAIAVTGFPCTWIGGKLRTR